MRRSAGGAEGGGRDSEPKLLWEVSADDFVYTCALSADLQYCAFGGVQKTVVVLDGRTGRELFKVR